MPLFAIQSMFTIDTSPCVKQNFGTMNTDQLLDRTVPSALTIRTCNDPARINDLKLEVNRVIWQYAPAETTLGVADEVASKIVNSILAGKYLV